MKAGTFFRILIPCIALFISCAALSEEYQDENAQPFYRSAEIFEPIDLHTHGGSVVELPNGDLMAAWFEGTGERWTDEVKIRGSRDWWNMRVQSMLDSNIQAAIGEKADGGLVIYMRDNGPPPKRMHMSSSYDRGETWSPVTYSELPNPGSGSDVITSTDGGQTWSDPAERGVPNPYSRVALIKLESGNLLKAYNPTVNAPRTPLRLSLSEDHGETWPYWVDVETNLERRYDYPYLIQARDGRIHLGYSHNNKQTIRHIVFDEAYVRAGQFLFSDEGNSVAAFKNGEFSITNLE